MTSQNDEVGLVMPGYSADFKGRISRQTSECNMIRTIQERLYFGFKSVLGFLIYFEQLGVTAIKRLQPIIQGMKNVQFGPMVPSDLDTFFQHRSTGRGELQCNEDSFKHGSPPFLLDGRFQ
jgi:hypothetical protein